MRAPPAGGARRVRSMKLGAGLQPPDRSSFGHALGLAVRSLWGSCPLGGEPGPRLRVRGSTLCAWALPYSSEPASS
jgi:hypothetical protein